MRRKKTRKELYGAIAERLYVDSGIDVPDIHEHYLPHVSVKLLELWRAEEKWREKAKKKALSAGKIASSIEGMMVELTQETTVANADAIQKLNKSLQYYKTVSESHFPERAVEVFERFTAFVREHVKQPGKRAEIFDLIKVFLGELT